MFHLLIRQTYIAYFPDNKNKIAKSKNIKETLKKNQNMKVW